MRVEKGEHLQKLQAVRFWGAPLAADVELIEHFENPLLLQEKHANTHFLMLIKLQNAKLRFE